MPIFIALGFYKILPNKDFRCEIIVGYIVELMTSTVPMLGAQVMNNSATVGSLTWLQVTSLSLRIASLLIFIIEAIIFLWESFINFKMRKTNIRQYKRLTDQQRVEVYGRKHAKIATLGLFASLLVIFFGSILISRRACAPVKEGQSPKVLHWGVCSACPENCLDCESVDTCSSCKSGFYLSPDSTGCLDCDLDST